MHLMLAERNYRRHRVGTQGQDLAFNTVRNAAFAQFEHHVLDAADGFRQIGFVKV
ncbi:hypothetical protein D3C72_2420570 [compost metagenome]